MGGSDTQKILVIVRLKVLGFTHSTKKYFQNITTELKSEAELQRLAEQADRKPEAELEGLAVQAGR